MENIRKFYLPIVHFVSLGLLGYMLIISPFYFEYEKGTTRDEIKKLSGSYTAVYSPNYNGSRVHNLRNKISGSTDMTMDVVDKLSAILLVDIETERQNRALIVYTLLAMYLGSGYLLFKKN